MAKRLEVLPAAVAEAVAAAGWYRERDERVAGAFEDDLARAFAEIERTPEAWPVHLHGTRRFLLRRFPYEVVYKVYPEVALIVAVAHCKRRPGYWRRR